MSNPLKAVGKVFKKVIKVVKKVAIPALMIGAVVLTGGAALGALPAIGTILGSVGISGTLASVLGGAISMGAIGAVTGGVMGAATGKGFMKGATGGFLMGAATGGVMGGLGMIGANGVLGGLSKGASAVATSGGAQVPTTGTGLLAQSASTAGTSVGQAAAQAGANVAAGGVAPQVAGQAARQGLLSQLAPTLLQGAGSIISGFSAGKSQEAQLKAQRENDRDEYDRIAFNYGYRNIYDKDKKGRTVGGVPVDQQAWYDYATPTFNTPGYADNSAITQGLLRTNPSPLIPTTYQIINGQVVPAGAA